ncbi:TetR/AcrR family transcriptional regulator [Blastomonas sp. UPD001]|uniref:TetR/AcrR family transcriptional regulator n=1 Tax=Blastomonas sp. UPD001 TaxID=2217673 RepID=UPI000E347854|nr:TetR/AcrR family transcriptional regulator [Blastomonas sp. UPD001]
MRTSYHHGDARAALIEAGLKLLATTPATELSLRQVAEAAGLSRQAPYNHFGSKEGLLAALAQTGFEALSSAMDRALDLADAEEPKLAALAKAYIEFALASPQRFRLMFQRELVDLSAYPAAAAASAAAFGRLAALVSSIVGEAAAADQAIAAWSLVHGYATLSNELEFEAAEAIDQRSRQFAALICKD